MSQMDDDDDDDAEEDEDEDDNEDDKVELVSATKATRGERIDPTDDQPFVGSWWWVNAGKGTSKNDLDRGRQWLGCVIEVGSNYAKLEGVRFSIRIALDDMPRRCTAEPDPDPFVAMKIGYHKGEVRALMGEIKRVCALLGVPMNQALAASEASTSTALAVAHGVDDIKKHKKALVKAKDKTLPELFEKVKEQHKAMAMWMKAELIHADAELNRAQGVTKIIEGKIHMVDLYAGLQEELVQVRDGDAAPVNARVRLMQRRHFMDEECLAKYEAGGMDFKGIKAFDKWLGRDENFTRILPHERCIVAFRVRRYDKDYGDRGGKDYLSNFIKFAEFNKANKWTFLYIRNGRQLWRMSTDIDFDDELFPRREDSDLLGDDEMWVKPQEGDWSDKFITGRQRAVMINEWKAKRTQHARELWAWHRLGKPEDRWEMPEYAREKGRLASNYWETGRPWENHSCRDAGWQRYERITPTNIYHDDAMAKIAKAAMEQNRIAVIVQGLLDRSTCLHPHPPWRIWTPEGFTAGIELVYDVSLAVTSGDAPNWEDYRAQINKSIREGCYTIGQRRAWEDRMGDLHGDKWRHYDKYGEGPDRIDVVSKVVKTDGSCVFAFERNRVKAKWVPGRPGFIKATYPKIQMTWRCPIEHLTCIDAYTPGDFHMFFDDPRTRADYLKWAPILLAAEDWHHARRNAPDEPAAYDDDESDDES